MNIIPWAILAFLVGSLVEWTAHKLILHNFRIKRLSKFHFGRHHKKSRKNMGYDKDYLKFPPVSLEGGLHEIFSLMLIVVIAVPLILISAWLWIFLMIHVCTYYYLHRKMHLNPAWCKKYFSWHWRHHMGKDQNSNWGVTTPIFDYVFGTVKK